MGSTGTGKFSDYSSSGSGTGASGASGGSGADPNDRCLKAFSDQLQDVEHSPYFLKHGAPPPTGIVLSLRHAKRIEAVDPDGLAIGNLPTGLNYLADCLAAGFEYTGEVSSSVSGSIAKVMVSFAPVT